MEIMEAKLTFGEEIAVISAISLRILDLSKIINNCRTLVQDLGVLDSAVQDLGVLETSLATLKSAYKKLTGIDFKSVHRD